MIKINKYNNGKIYKIMSTIINDVYIGSTILPLDIRFNTHKLGYKNFINGTKFKYCCSYDLFHLDPV